MEVKGEVHGIARSSGGTRAPGFRYAPPRRHGGASGADRARPAGPAAPLRRRSRQVLGREAAVHLLPRHLRPEAHRPHRPSARLRCLRPRHPRPRPSARRVRRRSTISWPRPRSWRWRPCACRRGARSARVRATAWATWPACWSAMPRTQAARTGVTVVLADPPALAAVDVRGGAPGTINTDVLRLGGLISRVDGVVLSGGSVFGLEAAPA